MEDRCLCPILSGLERWWEVWIGRALRAVHFWMFAGCWALFCLSPSPAASVYRG